MKQKELAELSDQELLQEQKKMKSSNTINALLTGIFIGIAVYSTVKNGLGFFTFFPLVFAFIVFNNRNKIKALEKELKSRNLK
jgi:hypothetical protein